MHDWKKIHCKLTNNWNSFIVVLKKKIYEGTFQEKDKYCVYIFFSGGLLLPCKINCTRTKKQATNVIGPLDDKCVKGLLKDLKETAEKLNEPKPRGYTAGHCSARPKGAL